MFQKGMNMKNIVLGIVLVGVLVALSGCETIKGVGQDIQNTGDNVWEAMTKNKN